MKSIEHDVFICCREPSGMDLAKLVAAGLTRRGFRVFLEDRVPGSMADERRLKVIDETPDFVLLLTPGALDPCADGQDAMRLEIAQAFRADRHVVMVAVPGHEKLHAGALPPDLSPLLDCQQVEYNPGRVEESIALISHRMSSDPAVDERRVMRQAKWVFWTAGLAVLAVIVLEMVPIVARMLVPPIDQQPLPRMALYWTGFGQRLDNGRWVEFALADATPVRGGDQLRFVFTPSADGFAYVLSQDLRGEVSVHFPPATLRGASQVHAGTLYEAPVNGGWLTVNEQAGLDTVYVLASYEPIENLEELAEETDRGPDTLDRRELLQTTVGGLLDGRHGSGARRAWTGKGRRILQSLAIPPGPPTGSATLKSGLVVTHALLTQPGLLSANVEMRVRFERGR